MKFFIDTADVTEIRDINETGMVDGVTTNPSLIAKSGAKIADVIAEICDIVDGPVSAEVTATDYAGMMKEGQYLAAIANNVAVKVPLTVDGLRTCKALTGAGTCWPPRQGRPSFLRLSAGSTISDRTEWS